MLGNNWKYNELTSTQKMVLKPKPFPIMIVPAMSNTALSTRYVNEIGKPKA